jgi:hypothetical protein
VTVSFDEDILYVTIPDTAPPFVTVNPTVNQVTIAQAGLQGPPGPASPLDRFAYTHNQTSPSSTWVIDHNLGWNPNVTVIDSAGTTVEGDIEYVSNNRVTLTFTAKGSPVAFSGTAYLS